MVVDMTGIEDEMRHRIHNYHQLTITEILRLEDHINNARLWWHGKMHKDGFANNRLYSTLSGKDMLLLTSRKVSNEINVISRTQSVFGDERFEYLVGRLVNQGQILEEKVQSLPSESYIYDSLDGDYLNHIVITSEQLKELHRYYLSSQLEEVESYDQHIIEIISIISILSMFMAFTIFIYMMHLIRSSIKDRDAVASRLKESNDMAQAILGTAEALIVVMDEQGRIEHFNHMCERVSLYSYEEVKGLYVWDVLFDEEQRDNIISIFYEMIKDRSRDSYKLWITTKSNEKRLIEWSSGVIEQSGEPVKLAAIGIDITEKQQVEDRLSRSQKNLSKAQEISSTGNWVWDIANNTLEWSDEIYRIFGVENKHLAVTYDDFLETIHPDDRERVEDAVLDSVADPACPYNIGHRIVRPNGEVLYVRELGEVIRDDEGNATMMIGTVQDRTEQVAANDKLYQQALIIDQTHDSVITTDHEGIITGWNDASVRLLGYSSEEAIGKHIAFIYPEERHDFLLHEIIEPLHKNGSGDHEVELLSKSGKLIDVHLSLSLLADGAGKVIGMVGHSLDISDRGKAEKVLLKEKNRAQTYLDIAGTILIALDDKGIVQLINRKGCEILECVEDQVIGKNWFDKYIPERVRDSVKQTYDHLMQGELELVAIYENPVITENGEERDVLWNNSIVYDDGGKPIGTLSSGEDITERKLNEAELHQQAMILEQVHDAVIVVDLDGMVTSWNKGAEDMFGYTADEALGMSVSVLHGDSNGSDYNLGNIIDTVMQKGAYDLDAIRRRKNGQLFNAQSSLSLQYDQDGKVIGIIGYTRDISQRIETEKQLTKSLAEKEVLLRELHHRVKNILQIISSLINMQSRQIKDDKAREAFVETRDRIRAVALIYEKLFGESNLSEIDVKKYIEYIAGRLDPVYEAGLRGIKTEITGDPIVLNMERALPCGLIVNELLTNIYKHAFSDGSSGHAKVALSIDGKSGYSIIVTDDGVGIENKEKSDSSFGMDIMSTLTRQIDGDFEISGKQGTTARLTFGK